MLVAADRSVVSFPIPSKRYPHPVLASRSGSHTPRTSRSAKSSSCHQRISRFCNASNVLWEAAQSRNLPAATSCLNPRQLSHPHSHARTPTTHPCHEQERGREHLKDERGALGLLVTAVGLSADRSSVVGRRPYPNSKCLQRFNDNCALVLQLVHSSLNTTFLVVLAFLWKTGLV